MQELGELFRGRRNIKQEFHTISLTMQVDFMLGSYMEDIGITPEQFEAACGVASKKIKSQFHQSLFEQA